jgi:hypothetical protein
MNAWWIYARFASREHVAPISCVTYAMIIATNARSFVKAATSAKNVREFAVAAELPVLIAMASVTNVGSVMIARMFFVTIVVDVPIVPILSAVFAREFVMIVRTYATTALPASIALPCAV